MDPDAVEIRVLGCLVEKQRTTPDAYPLSLNALLTACNQATSRHPVTAYGMDEVRAALQRLGRRGFTRLASGPGSRAVKYRHLLDEALRLPDGELALLCVLMLRGAQTPGELRARTERLHAFADAEAVQAALDGLAARGLAEQQPRQPGQKEARWFQRLGGADGDAEGGGAVVAGAAAAVTAPNASGGAEAVVAAPNASPPASGGGPGGGLAGGEPPAPAPPAGGAPADGRPRDREGEDDLVARVEALEREVAVLRSGLAQLRDDLGA